MILGRDPTIASNLDPSAFAVRGRLANSEVGDESHRDELGETVAEVAVNAPPRRVLIVDDNEDSAEAMAMLLERFGCQVSVAFNGQAALTQQEGAPFDVVLLDLSLPDMHGTAVAERMRSGGFAGKLVAVSGNSEPAMKERCARAGVDQFMVKPCSADALRKLV